MVPQGARRERVRAELVRLLRLALLALDDLRAFASSAAPAALAEWQVSLREAPVERSAASRSRNTLRRLRGKKTSPAPLPFPPLRDPARELAELIVTSALAAGTEHALLDAVGAARPHLVDEVVALRELLSGVEPPPRASRLPRVPATSAAPAPGLSGGGLSGREPFSYIRKGFDAPPPESKGVEIASEGADLGAGADDAPSAGDAPESGGEPSQPSAAAPPQPSATVPPQIVSLGFANRQDPSAFIVSRTLTVDEDYLFWLEIAPELSPRSAAGAVPMRGLAEGDILDVIVFGFPGQLELGDERAGRVRISAAGNRVIAPAWRHLPDELVALTLYFPVRTPRAPGVYAMRCNLYCRGLLVQSHLVTVEVTAQPAENRQAVRRVVDYNLTHSLDTARLGERSACTASVFLNDDGKGTHSFRFVSSNAGVPEQIADGHIDGAQLANAVRYAREALRFAAWGKHEPWTRGDKYLLATPNPKHLGDAWRKLARRGANLWMKLAEMFEWLGPQALLLREKMRAPGVLQLALKASPDAVLPAALIYDYPLDIAVSDLRMCEAASEAIAKGRELIDEPCFQGRCPSYQVADVFCPGGFWGFRHDLGLPIHLPRGEVATEIPRRGPVRAFAAISTDPAFVKRDAHVADLSSLLEGGLEILRDRQSCLTRLDEERHLVYFYCHGGLMPESDTPFLQVGPTDSDPLLAQSLLNGGVSWESLRPLVVLNGCHTTAASPDEMFSMLSAFAAHCNAAGVIGTEITNFEPIAVPFGKELIQRFLRGEPVGAAIRRARLALLRTGNPLGLMYVPFALPSLRLAA